MGSRFDCQDSVTFDGDTLPNSQVVRYTRILYGERCLLVCIALASGSPIICWVSCFWMGKGETNSFGCKPDSDDIRYPTRHREKTRGTEIEIPYSRQRLTGNLHSAGYRFCCD